MAGEAGDGEVEAVGGGLRAGAGGTPFEGPMVVSGAEADCGGGIEGSGVRGDHHALRRGEAHDLRGLAVDVRVGLVLASWLGTEDDVP